MGGEESKKPGLTPAFLLRLVASEPCLPIRGHRQWAEDSAPDQKLDHNENHLYGIGVHNSSRELWMRPAEVLPHRSGPFFYSTSTRMRGVTDELPGFELRLVGRKACMTCP